MSKFRGLICEGLHSFFITCSQVNCYICQMLVLPGKQPYKINENMQVFEQGYKITVIIKAGLHCMLQ